MLQALAALAGASTTGVRSPYAVLAARLSPAELAIAFDTAGCHAHGEASGVPARLAVRCAVRRQRRRRAAFPWPDVIGPPEVHGADRPTPGGPAGLSGPCRQAPAELTLGLLLRHLGGTANQRGRHGIDAKNTLSTFAQVRRHSDSTSRWPRQPAAFDQIGHRQPRKRSLR